MGTQIYTGFGYWNGASWTLSFLLAVLFVSWLAGLGRKNYGKAWIRRLPPVKFRDNGFLGAQPLQFSPTLSRGDKLSERLWEALSVDGIGWAVVATVLLLVAVLL